MLVIAALVAMHGAANHYRAGMTGDALLMLALSLYEITLAAFYLLGYGVALWRS
jgi:hypothetical protein